MSKILVVGSVNTDLIIYSNRIPKPGETILGGDFNKNLGGKGANQAIAASRMNAEVYLYALLGNDSFAEDHKRNFNKEGINFNFIQSDKEAPTGIALITVDKNGNNAISVAPGANTKLKLNRSEEILSLFTSDDIFITQLEIPLAAISKLKELSQKIGARMILNPAPAMAIPDKLFSNLFMITPNQFEAELLSGIPYKDQSSLKEMGQWFLNKGVQEVIITLGAAGVFWMNSHHQKVFPAKVVEAIDTTAAGDCFNGCLAALLSQKTKMETAIQKSIIAASISVQRKGAQTSMPYAYEIK